MKFGIDIYNSIIDDLSRRVWVNILKHKIDTYEKSKERHTFIGNQLGTKVNVLRTYNNL